MRRARGGLSRLDNRWRWGALVAAALLAVFLAWFFIFRDAPGRGASAPATPPPRPALGKTITFQEYTAEVNSALEEVRAARAASGEEREKKLRSAATTLEQVEGAGVNPPGGGSPAEVDNTFLTRGLRGEDPDLEELESSLATLSRSLSEQAGSPLPGTLDGAQANAGLREVLSDPAFERRVSPLQQLTRWLSQLTGEGDPQGNLWRWITALLAGIVAGAITYLATDRIPNRWARLGLSVLVGLLVGFLAAAVTAYITETLLVFASIGLVVAGIVAALFIVGVRRTSAPAAPRTVSELAAALGMSASEARRKADEAAGAGDYRGAIRYRCLAVLLDLDEEGRLVFDRAATDREYLFRAPGTLQDELQPLLTRFEEVWYGSAHAGEEDWRDYAARAAQVEARVAAEAQAEKAAQKRSAA